MIDQRCGPDFRNQFFLAVGLRTEERGFAQAVQALGVARGMGQFVKGGAVIFGGCGELASLGQGDGIGGGTIERTVSRRVGQGNAFPLTIGGNDGFGGFISRRG